ncbi:helix-turn-helix domain-containing protein [Streptomyces antimycoticus]
MLTAQLGPRASAESERPPGAGNGATAATAAAVYCHRNTAQHRFNRFLGLTGNDVRHPETAALVALVLRARSRRAGAQAPP